VQKFGSTLAKRPNTRVAIEMLEHWESLVRDALYLNFFNIPISEYAWTTRGSILADDKAETSKLDHIWILDQDIHDWLLEALGRSADMYLERTRWFEERKKRIEQLKNQQRRS
jgi:hypothetical protein